MSAGEDGQPELAFCTPEIAQDFALAALQTGQVYVCDEDRFAMEALAALLRDALDRGVLTPADLMGTEPAVIARLRADTVSGPAWDRFRRFHTIRTAAGERPEGGFWVRVNAKRRLDRPAGSGPGAGSPPGPRRFGRPSRLFCPWTSPVGSVLSDRVREAQPPIPAHPRRRT